MVFAAGEVGASDQGLSESGVPGAPPRHCWRLLECPRLDVPVAESECRRRPGSGAFGSSSGHVMASLTEAKRQLRVEGHQSKGQPTHPVIWAPSQIANRITAWASTAWARSAL